jgi:uncharacterized membrane protein
VDAENGYYVIKLLAHERERIAELDEIRADLRDYLLNLKAEQAYDAFIEKLSHEIYVDVRTGVAARE